MKKLITQLDDSIISGEQHFRNALLSGQVLISWHLSVLTLHVNCEAFDQQIIFFNYHKILYSCVCKIIYFCVYKILYSCVYSHINYIHNIISTQDDLHIFLYCNFSLFITL